MTMADPFWDLFTVEVTQEDSHFTFRDSDLMDRWIQVLQQYTGYPKQNHLGGLLTARGPFNLGISLEGLDCLKDAARNEPVRLLGDYWRLWGQFERVFNECYHGRHPQGPKTIWERLTA